MTGSALIRWAMLAVAAGLCAAPATAGASVGNFGMAVQPDGKIVVAGGAGVEIGGGRGKEAGAVARYMPDGKLDRGFGRNGIVIVRSHNSLTDPIEPFTALALQPNGRILVASPIGELSRLLPDGKLDGSFGAGGIATAGTISAYYPTAVAVEPDRSILVGGTTGYLTDPGEHLYGRIYRYTPNGRRSEWIGAMSPSSSPTDPKSAMSDFLAEPNGDVIAAGSVGPRPPLPARGHAALARVVPGGQDFPDPSFGGGVGLVESNFFPSSGFSETANAMAWDRGKLLLAGQAEAGLLLARYDRDGALDTGFGSGGATLTNVHGSAIDSANAVVVQHSGKIVVAGGSGYGCHIGDCASLALVRYKANGRLDRGFGSEGIVSPYVDAQRYGAPAAEVAYGVANQPGEEILVGGLLIAGGKARFFLRRYLPSGMPDTAFGDGGRVTTLPFRAVHGRG